MHHPPKKEPKKRGRLLPVVLVIALCLAAAFVLLLPRIRSVFPSPGTQAAVPTVSQRVFEITEKERLQSVTISPEAGESYTLNMSNGVLMLRTDDGLTDINDAYAQELLSAVTQIVGQGVVAEDASEVEEHLDDMGLAVPRASALMRYADGSEAMLEIGAAVPNTTYAYCRWSGSPAIYMCDAGVVDALNLTRSRLLPVEQPVIYAGLVEELVLETAEGRTRLTFADGAFGRMEEPYSYPLDAGASSGLLAALDQFRLGTLEGESQDRAAYGFEQPLCTVELTMSSGMTSEIDEAGELVTYFRPAQSLRFVIGRAEGEYFYTCEYEGRCYLISRFLAESLVQTSRASLLSRHPLDVGDLAVKSIRMETSGGTAQLQAVRTERVLPNNQLEMDNEGNVMYDTAVTLNGKACAPELLDEVVSRLDGFAVSAAAPADFAPAGEPEWSVALETETGLVRTVEAWKWDLFADVIAVDGTILHCVYSEAIDVLTEGLTGSNEVRDH